MKGSLPLHELSQAIARYASTEKSTFTWRSVGWVWDCLGPVPRLLAGLGLSASGWWKRKYVFPILAREASRFLRDFMEGRWSRPDEEELRALFSFFADPPAARFFAAQEEELASFLKTQPPSFAAAREAFYATLAQQGKRGVCSWFRDELYGSYVDRMRRLLEGAPLKKNEVEGAEAQRRQEPISEASRVRGRLLLGEFTSLKEKVAAGLPALDKHIRKFFPLRHEADEDIRLLQAGKETMLTACLSAEDAIMELSDVALVAPTDAEASAKLEEARAFFKQLHGRCDALRRQMEEAVNSLERVRVSVERRLETLSRDIDAVPHLPSPSALRPQQLRLIRAARERLRNFAASLPGGPGPDTDVDGLERELGAFVELARSLYFEGERIFDMKKPLEECEKKMRSMVHASLGAEAKGCFESLSAEVTQLKEGLEFVADRQATFDRLAQKLAELGITLSMG